MLFATHLPSPAKKVISRGGAGGRRKENGETMGAETILLLYVQCILNTKCRKAIMSQILNPELSRAISRLTLPLA